RTTRSEKRLSLLRIVAEVGVPTRSFSSICQYVAESVNPGVDLPFQTAPSDFDLPVSGSRFGLEPMMDGITAVRLPLRESCTVALSVDRAPSASARSGARKDSPYEARNRSPSIGRPSTPACGVVFEPNPS